MARKKVSKKGKAQVAKAGELKVGILGKAAADQLGKRITRQQIATLLGGLGDPYSKFTVGAPHVALSARVTWVENRGYLDIINPRTVHPSDPNVGFLAPPYGGNVDGHLDVWLLGLQVGASYFLQFRVGIGAPSAVWKIGSSQGPTIQIKTSGGPQHTLPVLLPAVDGTTELVILKVPGHDWLFYDVEVNLLT